MMAMDVSRIQEKSKLARELMQRGIASDFAEACKMIDDRGFVKDSRMSRVQSGDFDPTSEKDHTLALARPGEPSPIAALVGEKQKNGGGSAQASSTSSATTAAPVQFDTSRLEKIEKQLTEMYDFFKKYSHNNDNNLRELDQRLKDVARTVVQSARTPSSAREELNAEEVTIDAEPEKQKTLAPAKKESKHPQSHLDPKKFSVDTFFSNSNGKMLKK